MIFEEKPDLLLFVPALVLFVRLVYGFLFEFAGLQRGELSQRDERFVEVRELDVWLRPGAVAAPAAAVRGAAASVCSVGATLRIVSAARPLLRPAAVLLANFGPVPALLLAFGFPRA